MSGAREAQLSGLRTRCGLTRIIAVGFLRPCSLSVPIIRRFTGGGTVITDENTLYISLIMNKAQVPSSPLYPREVMKWSESFYAPVFNSLAPASAVVTAPFQLREHDYCFGEHKFGGNAQSISRDRWVHHTSMLWDYTPQLMSLLTLPDNRPDYRKDRDHGAFLTKLRERLHPHDREALVDRVLDRARETWDLHQVPLEQALGVLQRPQERASNTYVDY